MQNLIDDLKEALLPDASLFEGGELLKNAVIERALRMDPELIGMLVASHRLKSHFFTDVGGVLVFDKVAFQRFVSNKAFLPDSYTAFRNRIGLMHGDDYLKQSQDVVLAWPFKDCVLEGGMTREDRGRQEVFWNETLAPDDISRLFEPKVMTNFQRWDEEAVASGMPKPVGQIGMDDNLLIKGNNLLALHTLKARYAGKVKLIYIDPPYNTEDDSFQYNDKFSHSTWLTFMRNRAEVARDLLLNDGIFCVHLNDIEMHYAKVMLDEVFGRGNFIATIPRKTRSGKSDVPYKISQEFDWILIYTKGASKKSKLFQRTVSRRYHITSDFPNDPWRTTDLTTQRTADERPNSNFTMVNPRNGEEFPVNPERCWSVTVDSFQDFFDRNKIIFPGDYDFLDISGPVMRVFQSEEIQKNGDNFDKSYVSTSFVNKIMDDLLNKATNKSGTDEIQAIFRRKAFSYPKPEELIRRLLEYTTKKGDIILDFHVGSGTTISVAHKMGRRWIGIEQMDYIETLTTTRLKKVVEGEQGGISKAVEWSGGGSFIRADLLTWNESLVTRIRAASSIDDLDTIRADMLENGYLRHDLYRDELEAADLKELSLEDAQALLISCLDLNHLYVNIGDMADPTYGVSDEDQRLNRAFQEGDE